MLLPNVIQMLRQLWDKPSLPTAPTLVVRPASEAVPIAGTDYAKIKLRIVEEVDYKTEEQLEALSLVNTAQADRIHYLQDKIIELRYALANKEVQQQAQHQYFKNRELEIIHKANATQENLKKQKLAIEGNENTLSSQRQKIKEIERTLTLKRDTLQNVERHGPDMVATIQKLETMLADTLDRFKQREELLVAQRNNITDGNKKIHQKNIELSELKQQLLDANNQIQQLQTKIKNPKAPTPDPWLGKHVTSLHNHLNIINTLTAENFKYKDLLQSRNDEFKILVGHHSKLQEQVLALQEMLKIAREASGQPSSLLYEQLMSNTQVPSEASQDPNALRRQAQFYKHQIAQLQASVDRLTRQLQQALNDKNELLQAIDNYIDQDAAQKAANNTTSQQEHEA